MTHQLRLVTDPTPRTPWKLDPDTRQRGRRGVVAARAALAAAPTLFDLASDAA